MKKIILTYFLLSLSYLVNAQFRANTDLQWYREEDDEKKFNFGYFLGTNLMTFKVSPKARTDKNAQTQMSQDDGVNESGLVYLRQENHPGFSVGLNARLRIDDNFDLRTEPGLHFVQRDLFFDNYLADHEDPNLDHDQNLDKFSPQVKRVVKSTYLEVPFLLNFHGDRWINTRPYVQAGLGYVYNIQADENKEDDNSTGVFRMTTHNFNWQVEIGLDIYFKYFKLTPALKGMFFFNNELVPDKSTTDKYWAGSLNSISTRAFILSLKFE